MATRTDDEIEALFAIASAQSFVIRALVVAHPLPDLVRLYADQLLGQALAKPQCLDNPEIGLVLRTTVENLFAPAVTYPSDFPPAK